jgi:adenylate kinase family enzyme
LYRLLKKKLLENAYRNRGYILDGFPRTHKDAKNCFLYRPIKINEETGEPEEYEEEELEEGQEKSFDGYVQDP